MADHPFQQFMDQIAEWGGVDWRQSTDQLRRSFFAAARKFETDVPALAKVDDLIVDGAAGPLRARLYTPRAAGSPPGPGIVFYHGGGFVLGDLESHDILCRRLADSAGCRLLAIDYRRAPEHKFPAAFEDADAAYHWALSRAEAIGFDPDRTAVAGDSAGGNLAAGVALHALRTGEKEPAMQALLYPLLQFVDADPGRFRLREGFFLSGTALDFFKGAYLSPGADATDERISPLLSNDLRGAPPAYIITAGLDPLHDEGAAYAAKLAGMGVPVTHRDYPSQPHGFLMATAISVVARDAIAELGQAIGTTLGALPGNAAGRR